jgi:hypothetical protein
MKRSMMVFAALGLLATVGSASAMPTVAPLTQTTDVKQVAVVCGYRGCVRVYPRYYRPYGYYRRPYWRRYW